MDVASDALDFLAPIDDGTGNFARAIKVFMEMAGSAEHGAKIKAAYKAAKTRLRDPSRPVLRTRQAVAYDAVRRPGREPATPAKAPEFAEPLIFSIYLRARQELARIGISRLRTALSQSDAEVERGLASLSDDFFGDIIVEAERRMASNPGFARRMEAAESDIRDLRGEFPNLQTEWRAALDDSGDDECSCIAVGCNGRGDCREFCLGFWDCLLIILGIILVIVIAVI